MKLINLIPLKEMENPCWKGYEMVGTKKKDGREVPNCVPKNENIDEVINSDDDVNYGKVEPEEYDVDNYDDFKDFINCYTNLKNCSAGTNIFNGIIPHSGFPNMDNFYNHNQLTKLFNLDYARDYHHFDRVTSEFFVKQILKNLDS
jgi:hypothetical protein